MTRLNVATCRNCGAEFSPPLVGETSDLCPQCREQAQPPPAPPRPTLGELIRRFPATSILVGLNVLVYIVMVAKGVSPAEPSTAELLRWGADFGPLSLDGQSWRLLSSCFVHAGFLHLLFNMWCLWVLGLFVERFLGRATYVIAYILAGLGGAVASLWWDPRAVAVGASGAIFGLAGIMVPLLRSGRLSLPAEYLKHHSKSILAFIGYNLLFGFISPHIDNSAHLGGLVTGLFLGMLLPVAGAEEGLQRRIVAFGLGAAIIAGGFGYARSASAGTLAFVAGEEAIQAREWDTAAESLQAAIRSDPKQAQAYVDLGYVYMVQLKYAKAAAVLQKASELQPRNADVLGNLGMAYLRLGNLQSAEAVLKRAVEIQPKGSNLWFELALCYVGQGRMDEATHAAEIAVQTGPKNAAAREMLQKLKQAAPAQAPNTPAHP